MHIYGSGQPYIFYKHSFSTPGSARSSPCTHILSHITQTLKNAPAALQVQLVHFLAHVVLQRGVVSPHKVLVSGHRVPTVRLLLAAKRHRQGHATHVVICCVWWKNQEKRCRCIMLPLYGCSCLWNDTGTHIAFFVCVFFGGRSRRFTVFLLYGCSWLLNGTGTGAQHTFTNS